VVCRSAGALLVETDTMAPADAIFVLDGSFIDRAVEAADLFRAGFAPRILISRGGRDAAETFFDAEGVHLPTRAEVARDVLVNRLGLPASAVEPLTDPVDSTADEAALLAPRAAREHWARVIVITDRASTRRAGYIFRKRLGPNVTVIAWNNRRDGYDPARWWTTRAMVRVTFYELPKVLIYRIGLSG
jgi:uncharacterized SAM-binding protein YcdF (DUF218 family)